MEKILNLATVADNYKEGSILMASRKNGGSNSELDIGNQVLATSIVYSKDVNSLSDVKLDSVTTSRLDPEACYLRQRIIESLEEQGFVKDKDLSTPHLLDKDDLRKKHYPAIETARAKARTALFRHENKLLDRFASGDEVDPTHFCPRLVEVHPKTQDELLFRYARLQWSIPTSAGYGRRLRFLVVDDSNGKLVGLIGLNDPVFALGPRDNWIGWNHKQARHGLHNVMDAFVLGAVPPYSYLLGGKLVALLLVSNEVREVFDRKYGYSLSRIGQRNLCSQLLVITTTSALGRSSIYNRLRYNGRTVFQSVGYTKGSGDFHFSNELYTDIRRFAEQRCIATAKQERWGKGFRNRREVILKTLVALDLPTSWLYHGVRREVFVIPLASNAQEILRGESTHPQWYQASVKELTDFFVRRWMLPRASWDHRYQDFNPMSLRLWERSGCINGASDV